MQCKLSQVRIGAAQDCGLGIENSLEARWCRSCSGVSCLECTLDLHVSDETGVDSPNASYEFALVATWSEETADSPVQLARCLWFTTDRITGDG